MDEFNEENKYRNTSLGEKPQPWPIKLALKYGAKSEKQAHTIVLTISIILIIITIFYYKNMFFPSTEVLVKSEKDLPGSVLQKIEQADSNGIDFNDLTLKEIEELERLGVEF